MYLQVSQHAGVCLQPLAVKIALHRCMVQTFCAHKNGQQPTRPLKHGVLPLSDW